MNQEKLLMIDNYDSFTYNLYQYFGILGADVTVVRNDKLDINTFNFNDFDKIVISPGPGTPDDSGISLNLIEILKDKLPILGVCLGHQAIAQVFGARIVRAKKVMHGKTSKVYHNNDMLFKNIESPFIATRYHSLVIEKSSVPDNIKVIGYSDDNEIMAIKHIEYPIWGIQFHPESILTEVGFSILNNFLLI